MPTRIPLTLSAVAAACGQASDRPPAEPIRSDAGLADPAANGTRTPGECPFQMVIEDVFSISGRGSVVTGRVTAGSIKVGEEVEISGSDKAIKAKVTGVEAYRKLAETAQAGDDVGLLLAGVTRDQVRRGQSIRRARERPPAGCGEATAAEAAAKDAAKTQVLILEGEAIRAADIEGVVRDLALRPSGIAPSLSEALTMASARPPHLIIIGGGDDGGFEAGAVREMRARYPVPVIVVGDYPEARAGARAEPDCVILTQRGRPGVKAAVERALTLGGACTERSGGSD